MSCGGEFSGKGHKYESNEGYNLLILFSKNYGEEKYLYDFHYGQKLFLESSHDSLAAFYFANKSVFILIPALELTKKLGDFQKKNIPKNERTLLAS